MERLRLDAKLNRLSPEARSEWLKNPDNYKYYRKAVENSFTLGLDLQGGMYVTLEVSVEDILRSLSEVPDDTLFNAALQDALREYRQGKGDLLSLFAQKVKARSPNTRLAQFFAGPKLSLSYNASDEEVIDKLRKEVEAAVDQTYRILRTRIDQFGVVSPNIQRQPGTGRILLELPGVKDSERVRACCAPPPSWNSGPPTPSKKSSPFSSGLMKNYPPFKRVKLIRLLPILLPRLRIPP